MDSIFQSAGFTRACKNILQLYKNQPFLCTFMSTHLLCALEYEFPDRDFKIKTGDLFYKTDLLFLQNFDLNSQLGDETDEFRSEWDGHCWVELDDRYILDISLMRTVYSDAFNKRCKQDIINTVGHNKGLLIIDKTDPNIINNFPFRWIERNVLHDKVINGIVKAIDKYKDQLINI